MMQVWATYRNSDMTEGKGHMVLDKVFMYEQDAHEYINDQPGVFGRRAEHGWQNTNLGDWQVKPLWIMEHLEDGVEYTRQQAIKRAYQKLTPEEKAAVEYHVRNALT
jgi:hypothetical protein